MLKIYNSKEHNTNPNPSSQTLRGFLFNMNMCNTKYCPTCNLDKEKSQFGLNKSRYDGLQHQCNDCRKEYRKQNREKIAEGDRQYRLNNKEKCSITSKRWIENNRERSNEIKYDYYRRNRKKYSDNKNIRYSLDEMFNLKERLKSRISTFFRIKGLQKLKHTEELLGLDYEGVKIHLEKQFKEHMSWENRSEWHIDHITPLASAQTEEELIKLFHYTNLQPLWAAENIRKSDKILQYEIR